MLLVWRPDIKWGVCACAHMEPVFLSMLNTGVDPMLPSCCASSKHVDSSSVSSGDGLRMKIETSSEALQKWKVWVKLLIWENFCRLNYLLDLNSTVHPQGVLLTVGWALGRHECKGRSGFYFREKWFAFIFLCGGEERVGQNKCICKFFQWKSLNNGWFILCSRVLNKI